MRSSLGTRSSVCGRDFASTWSSASKTSAARCPKGPSTSSFVDTLRSPTSKNMCSEALPRSSAAESHHAVWWYLANTNRGLRTLHVSPNSRKACASIAWKSRPLTNEGRSSVETCTRHGTHAAAGASGGKHHDLRGSPLTARKSSNITQTSASSRVTSSTGICDIVIRMSRNAFCSCCLEVF